MKDKFYIGKIIDYIDEVLEYVSDESYDEFKKDRKTMSACAFNISQMGETVNNLTEYLKEKYIDIPWKSIKGMRNKIVHDYAM